MLNLIKIKLKQTYRFFDIFCESFFRFIFGQLAFTILPIVVIAIIRLSLGKTNELTTFLNDLSFATVVFYGLILTQTLELKKLQGDIYSFRAKMLIQVFILHLIISVSSLSMIVIHNNGILLNINYLKTLQLWLFWFSVLWLFIVYHTKVSYEKRKNIIDETTSKKEYYIYFDQSLMQAKSNLSYILYACERKSNINNKIENDIYEHSESYINDMESNFDSKINEIEIIIGKIKKNRKIKDTKTFRLYQKEAG